MSLMNEWISVKDKDPPKDETWILVVTIYKTYSAVRWYNGWDGLEFYDDSDENYCREINILYWMPLPEMPKD